MWFFHRLWITLPPVTSGKLPTLTIVRSESECHSHIRHMFVPSESTIILTVIGMVGIMGSLITLVYGNHMMTRYQSR